MRSRAPVSERAGTIAGVPAKPAPAAEVRQRVMLGMIAAVEEHGYANTTVGDIAKAAKISRRTLYEHFPDKQACFLAAYAMIADGLMSHVVTSARAQPIGPERIQGAVTAYLHALAVRPEVARSFLTEIKAAGREGLELYCQIVQRFATMFVDLFAEAERVLAAEPRDDMAPLASLDQMQALGMAGAINELVLQTIVGGPPETLPGRLERLAEPVTTLVERIVLVHDQVPHRRADD